MNLPTKQSETHKNEHGCRGKGILGSLGRSHPHCYIQNTKMTRTYCIAKNKQTIKALWHWYEERHTGKGNIIENK